MPSSVIVTPNMNLPNPVPTIDLGPDYAYNLQQSLNLVDMHNHTPGNGVAIPSNGLNINANLTMNGWSLVDVQSIQFAPQGSLSNLFSIYASGNDLYYNDGASNVIQITSGGAVNATSSGISSGSATASFVSSVLVVNQAANTPANIQVGSVLIGNNTAASDFITLSAPNPLSSNYTITLPALPSVPSFMQMDSSGNISETIAISGGITGSNIAAGTLTATNIANGTITTTQISSSAGITQGQLAAAAFEATTQTITSSGSFVVPTGVNQIDIQIIGGGGGGGGGGNNAGTGGPGGGGGGGAGTLFYYPRWAVTSGETLTVTIGSGGSGGTGGNSGSSGGTTTVTDGTFTLKALGGGGGGAGGHGGGGATNGSAGLSSYLAGGTGGVDSGNGGGGGGGGGGLMAGGNGGAGGGSVTTPTQPSFAIGTPYFCVPGGSGGGGQGVSTVSGANDGGAGGNSGSTGGISFGFTGGAGGVSSGTSSGSGGGGGASAFGNGGAGGNGTGTVGSGTGASGGSPGSTLYGAGGGGGGGSDIDGTATGGTGGTGAAGVVIISYVVGA
jgi:hypothetical protein